MKNIDPDGFDTVIQNNKGVNISKFLLRNKNPMCVKYIRFSDLIETQKRRIILSCNNGKNNMMRHCHGSMIDLGTISKPELQTLSWYSWLCDESSTFQQFFQYLTNKGGIDVNDYVFYVACERQNHTIRPTRELFKTQKEGRARSIHDKIKTEAPRCVKLTLHCVCCMRTTHLFFCLDFLLFVFFCMCLI